MAGPEISKIKWGRDSIAAYAGISVPKLMGLIKKHKFPANYIGGEWCAHTENIDDYFRKVTSQLTVDPDVISEDDEF
ncbi:MAG: hypothetical protein JXB42_12805 [Deltaproteobacteria bacterium]|nr:hypothetical protein [Deltaproteobacteria bacterium]